MQFYTYIVEAVCSAGSNVQPVDVSVGRAIHLYTCFFRSDHKHQGRYHQRVHNDL